MKRREIKLTFDTVLGTTLYENKKNETKKSAQKNVIFFFSTFQKRISKDELEDFFFSQHRYEKKEWCLNGFL